MFYGPLLNGATSVLFGGNITWPDAGRPWRIVDKHAATVFYTAPTLVRALQRAGDEHLLPHPSRSTLRVLATVRLVLLSSSPLCQMV